MKMLMIVVNGQGKASCCAPPWRGGHARLEKRRPARSPQLALPTGPGNRPPRRGRRGAAGRRLLEVLLAAEVAEVEVLLAPAAAVALLAEVDEVLAAMRAGNVAPTPATRDEM